MPALRRGGTEAKLPAPLDKRSRCNPWTCGDCKKHFIALGPGIVFQAAEVLLQGGSKTDMSARRMCRARPSCQRPQSTTFCPHSPRAPGRRPGGGTGDGVRGLGSGRGRLAAVP